MSALHLALGLFPSSVIRAAKTPAIDLPSGGRNALASVVALRQTESFFRRLTFEVLESRELLSGGPANVDVEFSPLPALVATVLWDNNATGNTAYEVDRSADGGSTWTTLSSTLPAGSTSYIDSSVTNGQAYEYRVEALTNGVASTLVTTLSEIASALPSPYSHGDIGAAATVGLAGSASYSAATATYTLSGAGADIWNATDGFQFAYTTLTGNGSCVVEVASMSNFALDGKAGIMMRNSLDPGSAYVDDFLSQTTNVDSEYRSSLGASANTNADGPAGYATAWLELTRTGNTFTAYYGTNGTTWTLLGSQTISMGNTIYVGMITCSHSPSQVATATFGNATLTGTTDQSPTIAAAALASPATATGTTANLSVLGADNGGEANLSYTWSALSVPTGATVTFSANGTNAAKSTTATFDMAGVYSFVATITNPVGLSVTSSVTVTVTQNLSSLVVTPAYASMGTGAQQQFAVEGCDQFGAVISSQPAVTWLVFSGGGSITSSGLYTSGNSAGSATIRATSGGLSGTASVAYSTPDVAWYQANQSSGSTLADSSGNSKTGTLLGSYSFGAGISGNALQLSGGYASLPTGIVSGLNNFTISAWVKLSSLTNWERIFDFGTGTSDYMFLTPDAGGTNLPRFAITTNGDNNEQRINSSIAIAANVWTNVAVTLSGNTATLYINGAVAGTNTNMSIHPTALGMTTQNYLGKSQFSGDPALNGSIEDVRIYKEALLTAQIQALQASNSPPTVSMAASASPGLASGTSTSLSVLGADNGGEASLVYTWSVTSLPSGASAADLQR